MESKFIIKPSPVYGRDVTVTQGSSGLWHVLRGGKNVVTGTLFRTKEDATAYALAYCRRNGDTFKGVEE